MSRAALRGIGLACLVAAALAAPGCRAKPSVRLVETRLGRDARVFLDQGDEEEPLEVRRRPDGALELPIRPPRRRSSFVQRLRVTEPGKPALVCAVEIHVDPDADEEDALHFRSSANRIVVKTATEGTAGRYEHHALVVYPEPLALLRDPGGGPWFLSAKGQGIVLVLDEDSGKGAGVHVAGEPHLLNALPNGRGFAPVVVRADAGPVRITVVRPGFQSYDADTEVVGGAFTLVAVRLAEERAE